MKILGHIHTFNDEEVIEQSLRAVLRQSHAVDEILIVDNHSVDGTLEREFPEQVTLIRHPENLGTSGAVVTGFQYALDNGYDWIWILDADSAPRPDALKKLVELYHSFSTQKQERVWLLSSLPVEISAEAITTPFSVRSAVMPEDPTPKPRHGVRFTANGYIRVQPGSDQRFYECDASIWSGCLYKLAAVQKIGLPSEDYVLDWGEYEYGYRGKQGGYQACMHQDSIMDHNITGQSSLSFTTYSLGPISWRMIELAPIRCYYVVRNTLYFWLHEFHARSLYAVLPRVFKIGILTFNFLLRPVSHWQELSACLRGLLDGFRGNLHRRY